MIESKSEPLTGEIDELADPRKLDILATNSLVEAGEDVNTGEPREIPCPTTTMLAALTFFIPTFEMSGRG